MVVVAKIILVFRVDGLQINCATEPTIVLLPGVR